MKKFGYCYFSPRQIEEIKSFYLGKPHKSKGILGLLLFKPVAQDQIKKILQEKGIVIDYIPPFIDPDSRARALNQCLSVSEIVLAETKDIINRWILCEVPDVNLDELLKAVYLVCKEIWFLLGLDLDKLLGQNSEKIREFAYDFVCAFHKYRQESLVPPWHWYPSLGWAVQDALRDAEKEFKDWISDL